MNNGWIKLYRSILEWEWWDDINTRTLFIYCLLMANSEERQWHGSAIPAGSFVTSRDSLAEGTGLTEQQVRTSLVKLKSTGEITSQSTNRNTIITICNYAMYQASAKDNQPTEQPTDNQQITSKTTNENPTDNQQITSKTTDTTDCDCDIYNSQSEGEQPANNQQITNNQPAEHLEINHKQEDKKYINNYNIISSNEDMSDLPSDASSDALEEKKIEEEKIDYQKLIAFWNEQTKGRWGTLRNIENNRRKMVRARIRVHGKEVFAEAILKACASDFLSTAQWFSFDWLILPNNFDKVISGNYDNKIIPNNGNNITSTNGTTNGTGAVTRPQNVGFGTDF